MLKFALASPVAWFGLYLNEFLLPFFVVVVLWLCFIEVRAHG
jgi:hypothetical protein